jgi:two-component system, response regulator, stage 0 sporulation protein F
LLYQEVIIMGGIMTSEHEMKTVLVVDDETDIRNAYAEALGELGCRVLSKPDGPSALASVKQGADIDLVITDYKMPDMNGLNFVKSLRTMRPSVPVIMITGCMSLENCLQSRKLGVFEYVDKPIRIDEFKRVVTAALEARKGQAPESKCP